MKKYLTTMERLYGFYFNEIKLNIFFLTQKTSFLNQSGPTIKNKFWIIFHLIKKKKNHLRENYLTVLIHL